MLARPIGGRLGGRKGMRTHTTTGWTLLRIALVRTALAALMVAGVTGCHADENDAAGQAGELGDAVRRENAIANISRLYTAALAHANGDRHATEPSHIADVTVPQLTQCFIDHSEDITG